MREERRVALSTELSSLAANPLVLRTRRANIFCPALPTRLSTSSVTQSLKLMVTPSIFKLLTLGRPGVGGGSETRLRGFLIMSSFYFEGLRFRLLAAAQLLRWASLVGMVEVLKAGTMR